MHYDDKWDLDSYWDESINAKYLYRHKGMAKSC